MNLKPLGFIFAGLMLLTVALSLDATLTRLILAITLAANVVLVILLIPLYDQVQRHQRALEWFMDHVYQNVPDTDQEVPEDLAGLI